MTVQELISEVGTLVGDTSSAFQSKLLVGLKRAFRRIPSFLYDDKLLTIYTSQVTEGNSELELPSYIMQVKTIFIYVNSSWVELKRPKVDQLIPLTTSGRPVKYALSKHTILFDRPVDKDYTLRIVCVNHNISALGLSTELDFTDDVIQLVEDALMYEAYMYRDRADLAQAALQAFKVQLEATLEMYSEDNVGSMIWDEE